MATNPNQPTDVPTIEQKQPPMPTPPQQGFTLLALLGILGLLLVFLALGYWIITQDFGLTPRLLLGAAGVCLAIFFWFNPGSIGSVFSIKGVRYGGNIFILVAALIGIVIVVNLLAGRYVLAQADLTSNGQYTLSDQTAQIMQNLQRDVSAHAFFSSQDPDRQAIETLLRQYKALSSHFSYEIVDYRQEPQKARNYQISAAETTVFELDPQHRESTTGVTEADLTGTLLKLLNPTTRTVYFLTGHGEHSIVATGDQTADQNSYSTISGSLVRERYDIQSLDLSKVAGITISGTTTLVIAGPQKPLSSQEIAKVNQFLAQGGRLMILADPPFQNRSLPDAAATLASLNQLLASYGASLGGGVVLDQAASQAGSDPSVLLVGQYGTSTITSKFNGFNALLYVADAVYTDRPVVTDTNTTRTPLLLSSSSSALYTALNSAGTALDPNKSTPGPFNLGVSLDYGTAGSADVTPGHKHTRIIVFGDSDFAANALINPQYVNSDLFLNAVDWLNQADQLSGIRAKTTDTRFLTLQPADANVIFYSSVLLLPLVVVIIGAAIWWRRR
jgi:ABC-type uncharacterized transport system involved in gliding motility auxiliary subunit